MENDRRDILLINPNLLRPPVAPLALEYLGASLRAEGWPVSLLDLCRSTESRNPLPERLEKNPPALIGITFRNLDDAYYLSGRGFLSGLAELVGDIRAACDVPVVLGGTGFSVAPEAVLRSTGAEYGIWGEGEGALPRLLQVLSPKSSVRSQEKALLASELEKIPGLFWREGDRIRHNPPAFCPDLDRLGLEARGCVDNGYYFHQGGMAGFEAKRGCDRRCIYCADPVAKGSRIRLRTPGSVADEIERLLEHAGVISSWSHVGSRFFSWYLSWNSIRHMKTSLYESGIQL